MARSYRLERFTSGTGEWAGTAPGPYRPAGPPGESATGTTKIEIRALQSDDGHSAVAVINRAAEWYAEFLPPAELHGPEMTLESWTEEARRMTWYGAFVGGLLVGVMAAEDAGDAVLFRHAYVVPERQRQGIASMLHAHLEDHVDDAARIIVGTYAANTKARAALEAAGYLLSSDSEAVLRRYYDIPEDRLRSSVTYEKRLDR